MMFSRRGLQCTRSLLGAQSRLATMPRPFLAMQTRTFAAPNDNFMSGQNANYIDYMYSQWEKDPSSVHASWNAYFSGGDASYQTPPTLGQTSGGAGSADIQAILSALQSSGAGVRAGSGDMSSDEMVRLNMLLRAYMTHGHYIANIDPLQLKDHYADSPSLAQKFRFPDQALLSMLDPAHYGFTE